MLLGELRDSFASKWGNGNDYALQQRIQLAIIASRATIIQRRYDSTKIFPQSLIQTATSLQLIRVEAEECPTGATGYKSIRTVRKVPKPLIVKDDSYFNFVGTSSVAKGFSYVPFQDIQFIKNRRFSSREIFYSYNNDFIYLINSASLGDLRVRYVPENIVEFKNFATAANEDTIEDEDIVIEDSLIEGIKGLLEADKPAIYANREDAEIQINE